MLEPHRDFIIERVSRTPHLTLHGLKDVLAKERGVKVSHNAVWLSALRGTSVQKTMFALEQARADIASRRQQWRSAQGALDRRCLVFIDETWIKTNMAPLRGWGSKGRRLHGFAPHGHWRT